MSKTEEIIALIKNLNAISIVWNYFGFEANDQATPNPGKDETLVCQSFKKGGNMRNLQCNGAHQWTPCWALCWSNFSAKSRDKAIRGKNAAAAMVPPLVLVNNQCTIHQRISKKFY